MLEDILFLLYRYPSSCRMLGSALFSLGGIGLVAGAGLQVGKTALTAIMHMAGQPPMRQAEQLLPDILNWWIPETFAGCVLYAGVLTAGAALAITAKRVQRCLQMR